MVETGAVFKGELLIETEVGYEISVTPSVAYPVPVITGRVFLKNAELAREKALLMLQMADGRRLEFYLLDDQGSIQAVRLHEP